MGLDEIPPAPPATAPSVAVTPPAAATVDLAEDDEMREIFLEEAREVVETANAACADLAESPGDLNQLTTMRRAFHTLKGSSRMVGLKAFGDAAWACEQLYNTRLADQQPADDALLQFTRWSLDYLGGPGKEGFTASNSMTAQLAILNWHLVLLYPKGSSARESVS